MPLLDYSVLNISSCCCFLGKNEILSKSWWKIVESEYYSGMEHSLSHLAAITESKKSLHPSCFILKLIRIFDTAWQSWILRQMARPQECVWSRVGAKRDIWVGPAWASFVGRGGGGTCRPARVTRLPRKWIHLVRDSTNWTWWRAHVKLWI